MPTLIGRTVRVRSQRAGTHLVNDRVGWHNDRPRRHRDEAVAPIAAGSGS
jgi:hypothetical protein